MQILPTGGIAAFEGSNIEKLRKRRLSEGARHWYVKRAEDVIKAVPRPKLLDHGVDDFNRYLEEQGRKQGLQGWQFLQIVDAIQILFETARAPAGAQVNWEQWRSSAQALEDSHPTIARTGGNLPSAEPVGRMSLLDDVRTTMTYTHTVKSVTLKEAKSPLAFEPPVS